MPELHFVNGYHKIHLTLTRFCKIALVGDLENGRHKNWFFSYHGMPKLFLHYSDPLPRLCLQTISLVSEKKPDKDGNKVLFKAVLVKRMVKAHTDATLAASSDENITDVAIISPAFSADCLETLEELEEEKSRTFENAGGEKYRYIPALNDRDDHISALYDVLNLCFKSKGVDLNIKSGVNLIPLFNFKERHLLKNN
ncbi:ferrochelatase (plasmid) [Pseudoalteromonas espejiana]